MHAAEDHDLAHVSLRGYWTPSDLSSRLTRGDSNKRYYRAVDEHHYGGIRERTCP